MSIQARRLQAAAHPTKLANPSGQPLPVGNLAGWTQVFLEDFNVDAPTGSWGTTVADVVVYTGDHSGKWTVYPDGWPSTNSGSNPGYMPSAVLSCHDSVLDFYLHQVNGLPAGANPCPYINGTDGYQAYGRYDARFKVVYNDDSQLDQYAIAWLLWPKNDADWQSAESDFPEQDNLNQQSVDAFAHYGGSGNQDYFTAAVDLTQWHTYTQEWLPGQRSYYLDGTLVGTSTNQVWSGIERWQLQTELSTASDPTTTGHILLDWVSVYAPAP